ncbi:MAG: GatB/YqeY domain-containing protein [Bacteroidia bacterium]|nr:GatB/YqeY domain-containing protein [Bacteroidia bacterium]NNC85061.1 GatB/YqeY domain-containing protein [Bacteroidia bacterium]
MSLADKIGAELKAAMLAKDEAKLRGLRAIKSALLLAATSGADKTISEDDEIKILQKLVKQRKDSADIYKQQNREDLLKPELEEIEVISKFLPAQLGEEEISNQLKEIIAKVGASSPSDMGKVMGMASKQFAGKADNKLVAALVQKLLRS